MIELINIADLKYPNDPQNRTYREVNNAKKHKYNVDDLVEIEHGVRMFIVQLTRDCDGTLLYSLSPNKNHTNSDYHHGYSEDGMKAI